MVGVPGKRGLNEEESPRVIIERRRDNLADQTSGCRLTPKVEER